jgi:hypothetical protein
MVHGEAERSPLHDQIAARFVTATAYLSRQLPSHGSAMSHDRRADRFPQPHHVTAARLASDIVFSRGAEEM